MRGRCESRVHKAAILKLNELQTPAGLVRVLFVWAGPGTGILEGLAMPSCGHVWRLLLTHHLLLNGFSGEAFGIKSENQFQTAANLPPKPPCR